MPRTPFATIKAVSREMPFMDRRTRVLHPITRMIIGGAQENTMLTAACLDQNRWDVSVVCGPQTGSEGSLIDAVRSRKIPLCIERTLVREIHPLKDLLALFRLTRRMRNGKYTVVHTHSSKAGILGRWAAKLAGVPVIVHTVHGWGHHERQHPIVRWIYVLAEKVTLPITDRLIVVSGLNIDKGLEDGIGERDDYVVIRSGIELDRFMNPKRTGEEMREELGIPLGVPVIGTVTRLSEQKAPLDFLAAAAKVHEQNSDVRFVMVGDGPLLTEVQDRITNLGLNHRVCLTGLRRDIPELLGAFDIFALSSLWEGLPRVLPQAMAAGLPLVATSVDGSAEVIEDGINGLLTQPGDPISLSKAMTRLLSDRDLAKSMGKKNRTKVDEFGAQRMVHLIEELYCEILQAKGLASELVSEPNEKEAELCVC